jgi:hypothetical protein
LSHQRQSLLDLASIRERVTKRYLRLEFHLGCASSPGRIYGVSRDFGGSLVLI